MKTRTPFLPFLVCLVLVLGFMTSAFPVQVTFQVNMSSQIALGNFDAASDTVSVAGDPLNAWSTSASPLVASAADARIWVGTFDVSGTAGSTAQYKFVITTAAGTTTWEGNVGAGGGTANRTFTLADADQTLPVVFFNNVSNSTTVSAPMTFQVNLSVQTTQGGFDPASGTVTVAGEFNGWSPTAFPLAPSSGNPDIWIGTVTLSGARDSSVSYKFVLNGGTWEGNVGSNGAQNRSLTLAATAQTLPVVFFNNLASIPTVIPVTFQLNLGTLIAQGKFDPAADSVVVAGDLLNNWNTSASVLTRTGPNSDLWTGTFDITGATGTALLFKYVRNGGIWETIENRTYTMASTTAQTVPPVFFDNIGDLGLLVPGKVVGGKLSLSWTAGPLIRLQTSANPIGATWQDVPGTVGQGSADVTIGTGSAYFRLIGP